MNVQELAAVLARHIEAGGGDDPVYVVLADPGREAVGGRVLDRLPQHDWPVGGAQREAGFVVLTAGPEVGGASPRASGRRLAYVLDRVLGRR